jgi:hypothetical protein
MRRVGPRSPRHRGTATQIGGARITVLEVRPPSSRRPVIELTDPTVRHRWNRIALVRTTSHVAAENPIDDSGAPSTTFCAPRKQSADLTGLLAGIGLLQLYVRIRGGPGRAIARGYPTA